MKSTARRLPTAFTGTLLLFLLAIGVGCSQNDATNDNPTAPGDQQSLTVEDPIYELLKAEDANVPEPTGDRIGRLAELLGLDQAQIDALAEAYATFRAEVADVRTQLSDGTITRAEAWELVTAAREELEAAIQVILTEEQYAQFLELRMHHGPGPGPRNGDPIAMWTLWLDQIGASAEQSQAVLAAVEELMDGMAELRTQVLNDELTREEAHAAAMDLRAAFEATLHEILTPEQLAALRELRLDRQHDRR